MNKWVGMAAAGLGWLIFSFFVFRVLVRNDYASKGRLSIFTCLLEFLVFLLHGIWMSMDLPTEWPIVSVSLGAAAAGLFFTLLGTAGVVLSIIILGLRRSTGLQVDNLQVRGMYRFSRNPQLLYYGVLLIGFVLLWPSWTGWAGLILYAAAAHLMVLTEEGHLLAAHSDNYTRYCSQVSRYF